ncbi:MAG: DUF2461 domain-containing protein [Spirochaetota bacterium]
MGKEVICSKEDQVKDSSVFNGFTKNTVVFYEELAVNNDKLWFQENKERYKEYVLLPAQNFVIEMSQRLMSLSPGVIGDTRPNGAGSIFRIQRDIRFSKDKSPYKTHLGIFFWEGMGKKMESSGFYFHLEPPNLLLYAGIYEFDKQQLEEFRSSVVHPKYGKELKKAVEKVLSAGSYKIGGSHYKKIPRGYDGNHENAEFLLYNSLYSVSEQKIPDQFYSDKLVDYCFKKFSDMYPIHQFIVKICKRVAGIS